MKLTKVYKGKSKAYYLFTYNKKKILKTIAEYETILIDMFHSKYKIDCPG